MTDIIPSFHLTSDILLCAIFGGILNGVAIGICLLSNATSGGTDFISIFISRRFGKDAWNYIFAANVLVLTVSGFLFGVEGAMYSIILQFASTAVIQSMYKRYQKHTLCIITNYPQKVYERIVSLSHHDSTLFRGVGMFQGKERHMIYSVIASDELHPIVHEIRKADPKAFINILKSTQVEGNFYQRPQD
ncbi:MAG TPA: YitT family protein [Lachnospiraceae bacterium]|nr:YitT family protein [Lachnospiraceae bacterium]